jgi:hypothetical protein
MDNNECARLAQVMQPVADVDVHIGAGGGGGGHLADNARLQAPVPLQRPPRPNGRLLQVDLRQDVKKVC